MKSRQQVQIFLAIPWIAESFPETQDPMTILGLWECPGNLESPWTFGLFQKPGKSLDIRTIPEAMDSPNFNVFDTCCRPSKKLSLLLWNSTIVKVMPQKKTQKW